MTMYRMPHPHAPHLRQTVRGIATGASLALLGCMDVRPAEPPMLTYSGQYVAVRANGASLPVAVTTSYDSGQLTLATLSSGTRLTSW